MMGWLLWNHRGQFSHVLRHLRIDLFLLAVGLGAVFTTLQGLLLIPLGRKYGVDSEPRLLLAAFLISQPGKYVPGKIWSPVMQSLVVGQLSRLPGLAMANVELAVIGVLQMVTLGLAFLFAGSPARMGLVLALGWAGCSLALRIPWGSLATRFWPRITESLGVAPTQEPTALPSLAQATLLSAATLAVNLAASWTVLVAVGATVPATLRSPLLACLYLGFAASIPVVVVPAGLGIREAAAVGAGKWLSQAIPSALLVSIALLARFWQIAVDLVCLIAGLLMLPARGAKR
jgi:glycosyltransferase 2 family protein